MIMMIIMMIVVIIITTRTNFLATVSNTLYELFHVAFQTMIRYPYIIPVGKWNVKKQAPKDSANNKLRFKSNPNHLNFRHLISNNRRALYVIIRDRGIFLSLKTQLFR